MPQGPTFRAFARLASQRWSETVTGSQSASYIILTAVLGVVDVIAATLINEPLWLKVTIGTVPPILFFLIAFIYAVFSVWREEYKKVIALERRLSPVLELNFDQHSDGIVHVPTKVSELDVHGRPTFDAGGMQIIYDSHGAYVRIRLSASSDVMVRGCAAFVTKIEKRDGDRRFNEIRMPQAHRLSPAFTDVFPRVPQTVDFLQAGESDNKLYLSGGASFALTNAFAENTTYRFTLNVVPQSGPDRAIIVEIDWRGEWNTISGRQVELL